MPIVTLTQPWLTVETTTTAADTAYWRQYAVSIAPVTTMTQSQPPNVYWSLIQSQNMWNTSTIQAYHAVNAQNAAAQSSWTVQQIDHTQAWRATLDTGEWRPPVRLLARPAIHSGRRALRRSIELYRRLRGTAELATFIAGQPIEVEGRRYAYRMQRSHVRLLEHTMRPHTAHTPYILQALDKATRRPLASGCVVMHDTPVIDQLLAVVMHTQDADAERHLIANTNWTPRLAA